MVLLNICKMPIRWTDLDAYGHLNNSKFFDFMTEARAELLKSVLKIEGMCPFVTVHVECDYKSPYHYPDLVLLKQYCESIGSSKFVLKYEFYSETKPDFLHAHATAIMVAYDPNTKRPTRMPSEIVTFW